MKTSKLMVLGLLIAGVSAAYAGNSPQTVAPGYGALEFSPPSVGSYSLPAIGTADDGNVLTSEGKPIKLHSLMGDKPVLLSFIYSTCSDVNGCPLATAVFHKIKNRLEKDPELASLVRLVTLSFDPGHDTPDKMRQYSEGLSGNGVDWHFLTTASEQELQPILSSYKQNIQKVYDEKGEFTGTYSHILRVYLIDTDKHIRNIYSTSFLHPDTLINDIKTLLNKNESSDPRLEVSSPLNPYRPGDSKTSYEKTGYVTQSLALSHRTGQSADLMKRVRTPPLGLPAMPQPAENKVTHEKIRLGRKLFYDRRLSLNNTFSCAMCHIPEQGFTSNEMATAVGIEGRSVKRNSPTLYNAGYATALFHDGRESTLEQQVWGPLLAHNEMANPSVGYVIDKLKVTDDYAEQFAKIFGKGPSMETVGMALASYERSLISGNSPFDRWHYGKEKRALSEAEQRGFTLFTGKAQCSSCHTIGPYDALLTDNTFHNTGIGYLEAMGTPDAKRKIQVAPGIFIDVDTDLIAQVSEVKAHDLGRYEVTQNPQDRWKYKTPTLRNVGLTAPYMHNGSLVTLKEVVEFYNRGGVANENLDPLIQPLNLSDQDINDLVSFLTTLTGDNVDELVADAFDAPVGDAD